jgi:hypothetical protein
MKTTCSNCRFASFAHSAAERGECRRFAPRTTLGQLEPDVRYGNPEMAVWPGVLRADTCGEFQVDHAPIETALVGIVRERVFGDGTAMCEQRVIDLCVDAQRRFGIERA